MLAFWRPRGLEFGTCLVLAFISDIFDGIIARRLNVATPNLRRLDSVVDTLFYLSVVFATWHLYPGAIKQRIVPLLALVALEIARYAIDLAKFGREASYHMWSSKLWGIFLFVGFFSVLALGYDGWPLTLAVYMGIVSDIEGLVISCVLQEWKTDVRSVIHALRARFERRT